MTAELSRPIYNLVHSWDQHNCETLMVDPQGEVYVVSKVAAHQHPKLVHLPASAWGAHHRVQVNDGILMQKTTTFVGGDISPDGHEVRLGASPGIYDC